MVAMERKCAICGKGPCRLRMAYRAVFPHAPICDGCAGPNPRLATATHDAWASDLRAPPWALQRVARVGHDRPRIGP
jgi:hypothetical protein